MNRDFKIQRCITFYKKNGDEFIGEKPLSENDFPLDYLIHIFKPEDEDPLLYRQYDITESVAMSINEKIDFVFDFDLYEYFLETFNVDVSSKASHVREKHL